MIAVGDKNRKEAVVGQAALIGREWASREMAGGILLAGVSASKSLKWLVSCIPNSLEFVEPKIPRGKL